MKSTTSERLRQLMSERNLRQVDILNLSQKYQKELGIKMGKSALSQYISGKSVPDQNKLVLLGRTLGVSETWLMGYDVPKERNDINADAKEQTIDLKATPAKRVAFDGREFDEADMEFMNSVMESYFKNKYKD